MYLHVSVLQAPLVWEDPVANLSYFGRKIGALGKTDLIVLPEMFATGFSMNPRHVADSEGRVLEWMQEMAEQTGAALCGSVMVADGGRYFNRLFFAGPEGHTWQYDKRHLFTMANEQAHYTAGKKRLLLEFKGFKLLPLICYDLRFPVFSRNDVEYDLLIYVANWPAKRAVHWNALLRARAIENQSYLVACNRIGKDGNGIDHWGDSLIIDYRGETLASLHREEGVVQARLDYKALQDGREKFPVLQDRDDFTSDWK